MNHRFFLRLTAAVTLVCFSASCVNQDFTPDSMNMLLDGKVKKERTADGGLSLVLSGSAIRYPQAAVEVFHRTADKHFGNRPYSYSYTIAREREKRTITEHPVLDTPSPAFYPIYPVGEGGAGGAAVATAAVLAVILLYNAMSGEHPRPPARKPQPRKAAPPKTKTVEVGKPQLVLRGTARPASPVTLDHTRAIQIVTPPDTTFRNKLATGSGQAAAEATAAALPGWKTQVVRGTTGGTGYILKPSLIRWADRSDFSLSSTTDTVTVEYELLDARSNRTLHRFVVHSVQSPLTGKLGIKPADVLKRAFAKRWAVNVR